MADNVVITAGTGTTVHADEYTHTTLGSGKTQLVKLVDGTLDAEAAIAADIGVKANALRVAPASNITDGTYIGDIKFGEAEPNSAAILADTTAILADTAAIQTAVELLDNAVDGNYLNVNANIAGTDMVGGAGAVAAGVQRITLASDDPAVVDLAAIEVLQTTIAGDTTSIDGKITACNTGAVVLAASDGTDIGNVDVASIAAGTNVVGKVRLVTALGDEVTEDTDDSIKVTIVSDDVGIGGGTQYTEDAVAAADPVGNAVIMVREDAPVSIAADGDNVAQRATAYGAGFVQVVDSSGNFIDTFGGSGGTAAADDADFVAGTTQGTPAMGVYESSPTSVTDGDLGTVGITQTRSLKVEETNSTAILADTASMDTNLGTLAGAVAGTEIQVDIVADGAGLATDAKLDTIIGHVDGLEALLTTIDADTSNMSSDSDVLVTNTAATVTALAVIDDWDATHDSAASADGVQLMAAYDSTKPAAVADGDAVRVLSDSYGRLLAGVEPQMWSATVNSADASSATQIKAAGGASTRHYITSIIISCGAAMNVTIQDDAGTPNVAMENMYFAANGGIALTFPPNTPLKMGADNQDIDLIASAAGNVTVVLTGYTI